MCVNKMWNLRVLVIGILPATTFLHCTLQHWKWRQHVPPKPL